MAGAVIGEAVQGTVLENGLKSGLDLASEKGKKLERAITIDMQVSMARDMKEILSNLSTLKENMSTSFSGLTGKFRDHILFVTFSKTPNFKVMVESLFQPYGKVPEFHSDEEACEELGLLLSKISGSPILLVTFPTIKSQIHLKPLRHEDALILFRHVALPKYNGSDIPSEILVEEVVRSCKGLPLAIKVIARSLCQQPEETWQKMVKLCLLNLANLLVTRKVESDRFSNYSNHFIMQHDLLRELAIYQSNQEPFERRRRLMVDINENNPQWRLEEEQPGIAARMLSTLFKLCVKQKQQPAIARTLSISTDEVFTSDWGNTQLSEIEALILNVRTKHYSFLKPIEKMRSLKVLICTNYGFHPARLENFELLDSLSSLKRIRMEKIFLPSLGKLKNLQKLSLYMCDTSEAFGNCKIPISDALPILVELNIDYCRDMVELPSGLSDIKTLRKLSISNCHKFTKLPQEIGRLENLELLRLNSCTDLGGIPESVGWLSRLRFLDISNCISLRDLPESIGNLKTMEKLYMSGCSRCDLPDSVINLEHLKV
ncbi:hypothetical protein K1719_029605 [Acacia pycnantha]|nr:hypothetical protein K1719_029605 [Acacia pycnantha]